MALVIVVILGLSVQPIYSQSETFTYTIAGSVQYDCECDGVGNGIVPGQQVVLYQLGIFVASTIADASGNFVIETAQTGTLTLCADQASVCDSPDTCIPVNLRNNQDPDTVVLLLSDPGTLELPEDLSITCDCENFGSLFYTTGTLVRSHCGTSTVFAESFETAGQCPTVITRTFTSSTGVEATQTIHVFDDTAPAFTLAPSDLTIECSQDIAQYQSWVETNGGAEAVDNCLGPLTWSNDAPDSFESACIKTITVTFTVSDQCGMSSASTATFQSIDSTAPVWTVAPSDFTTECFLSDTPGTYANWLDLPEAYDACFGSDIHIVKLAPPYTSGCNENTMVTWTASDACGRSRAGTAVFNVVDTTPPYFSVAPSSITVECSENLSEEFLTWLDSNGGAEAIDECDGLSTTIVNNGYEVGPVGVGITTITFQSTDGCGNTASTEASFSVTDSIAPTFSVLPEAIELDCNSSTFDSDLAAWLASAQAQDGCVGNLSVANNYGMLPESNACSLNFVTFTATDGYQSTSRTATFTVLDSTAPVFDIYPTSVTVECNYETNDIEFSDWVSNLAGAEASDSCSNVTWSTNSGLVEPEYDGCSTVTRITFFITNDCGLTERETASFTITDSTDPVLIIPPSSATAECGAGAVTAYYAWVESGGGAVLEDSCTAPGHSFVANIGYEGWTPTSADGFDGCSNSYTTDFTYSDACGNSVSASAEFFIQDTIAPYFTVLPEPLHIGCNSPTYDYELDQWLWRRVQAEDACDTSVYVGNDLWGSAALIPCETRPVIFTATDNCGRSTPVTTEITILDTEPPVIGNIPYPGTIECSSDTQSAYQTWLRESFISADDNCSRNFEITLVWSNDAPESVPVGCDVTTTITFEVTDACGLASSSETSVRVRDSQPPYFTNVPEPLSLECSTPFSDISDWLSQAAATDSCYSSVSITNNYSGALNACSTKVVTFTATDMCGLESSESSEIYLADYSAPELVQSGENSAASCTIGDTTNAAFDTWLNNRAYSVVEDNCTSSDNLIWSNNWDGEISCSSTEIVSWTIADSCGNTVSFSAEFQLLAN